MTCSVCLPFSWCHWVKWASCLWCLQTLGSLTARQIKMNKTIMLLSKYLSSSAIFVVKQQLEWVPAPSVETWRWFKVYFCVSVTTKERMWRIPLHISAGCCRFVLTCLTLQNTYLLCEACFANSDIAGCYTPTCDTHTHTHTPPCRSSYTNTQLWHTFCILSNKYVKHTLEYTLWRLMHSPSHTNRTHTFTHAVWGPE